MAVVRNSEVGDTSSVGPWKLIL